MSDPPQTDFEADAATALVKLNLGCGRNHHVGYVNVDRAPGAKPDLVWDLERDRPWPWAAGEVGDVLLHHVLEHISDIGTFMRELYRVCAPGARIEIRTPHQYSDGFHGDPTHTRAITLDVLNLFSQKKCEVFAERGWPNTPLAVYLGVDFEVESVEHDVMPAWKSLIAHPDTMRQAMESFVNVVNEVKFIVRRV